MLDRVSSGWVHYKLDRGVDHVLIDEAQDTSPRQWDIVAHIISEFTSGAGARDGVSAHHLRGRRREAVDLFVPGRRTARVRHAPARTASANSRCRAEIRSGVVHLFVPLGSRDPAIGRPRVSRRGDLPQHPFAETGYPVHNALADAGPSLIELWELAAARRQAGHRGLARAVRRGVADQPRSQTRPAHPGRDQAAGRRRHHDRPRPASAARCAMATCWCWCGGAATPSTR